MFFLKELYPVIEYMLFYKVAMQCVVKNWK